MRRNHARGSQESGEGKRMKLAVSGTVIGFQVGVVLVVVIHKAGRGRGPSPASPRRKGHGLLDTLSYCWRCGC